MDENIIDYFEMKLLQNPKREVQSDGYIKEIYNQPERSKREDLKYYYVCLEEDSCNCPNPWHTCFETDSKQEAEEWVNRMPHKRTWHEHIRDAVL